MRNWEEIRKNLWLSRDGSRIARQALVSELGADHGSDQVAWNETARQVLRTDVEAALTSLGALTPEVSAIFDRTDRAFYSLNPLDELSRAEDAVSSPALRKKINVYKTQLTKGPGPALEELVPEDRLFAGDSECVDAASDYECLVEAVLALAEIAPKSVSCTEKAGVRTLVVVVGRRRYTAKLRGDTDYVDEPPLIACMNEIVADTKQRRRFYEVADPRWGQELGIALLSATEAKKLRGAQMLVEDSDDE